MKPGHVVAALGMSLLLCGFTDPDPRLQANDEAPVASQPASVRTTSAETSTDTRPMTADDAVRAASVASPYKISEQAARGTIRYRIEMRDGVPWPWPETGEQHVEQDGSMVVLTICTTCGQEAPPTAAELQRDLQANHWADNSDRVIREFAGGVHAGNVDRSMRQLVGEVQKRIDGPVYYGKYRTSREAYDAQEGDCAESALLLAAAAKVRHIPVRVAFGMAYASRFLGRKRMFGPHMWVQAWNGKRWTSYDAGLGEFDSTHIALALGDGSPDGVPQVFAKLRDVLIVSAEGVLPAVAAGR
ncbi:MAG TPA: transglutaminase domain-containing protein [Xanthomonadaceae bacterium]|nr:transglutaminase domain-containing protein [Xanthomonadaceae bacterium]